MKAIEYRLRLIEPVLIAQVGAGEENSAIGMDFIPGSAIRGALVARWLRHHPGIDLARDPAARALFLDDVVCYLNAYPVVDHQRSLPVPASWFTEKESANDPNAIIYDFAVDPSSEMQLEVAKPPAGKFCAISRENYGSPGSASQSWVCFHDPDRFDQVHITLEDANQRGEGNLVFRYEALSADQSFAAAIMASDGFDLTPLFNLLNEGDLRIGSAHMAGYGRVKIEDCTLHESYHEFEASDSLTDGKVIVTLLSHTILRDKNGQAGNNGSSALFHELGGKPDAIPEWIFGSLVVVGGYNRKWSLPLPQDWAFAAGSSFVFDSSQIDLEKLHFILEHGVGERRAEGFGRIAAGWQSYPQLMRSNTPPMIEQVPGLCQASAEAAQNMVQRRLRLTLERSLIQRINANVGRFSGTCPRNSQLSAIRQVVLQGIMDGKMDKLKKYLDNLKSVGKKQLKDCRLGSQTLFDWIAHRAELLDVQEQLLEPGKSRLPIMAGTKAMLTNDLRLEFTARLIEGTMQQLAKGKENNK